MTLDFSRLRTGELVAGLGGVGLLVFLFLDWFSVGGDVPDLPAIEGIPGGSIEFDAGVSGWDSLQSLDGFLVVLAGFSGAALAGLAAAGRKLNAGRLPRGGITAVLGSLAVLIIIWKLLGQGGFEIGIYLGLLASAAIAAGAFMALKEDGYSPLVPVAGVATKKASATATGVARAQAGKAPAVRAAAGATAKKAPKKRSSSGGSKAGGAKKAPAGRASTKTTSAKTTRKAAAKKPAGQKARSAGRSGAKKK